ncbi:MAG: endonuclease/exonuclease/phosphatase family protein [Bdellovibrionaceae bacterium]|nr:endonuclease/exonuclease/phosphatase family protein [Pseudobdellovibrionaceae bacterium]
MLTWAKGQVYSVVIVVLVTTGLSALGQNLRISTFNIKWYGLKSSTDTVSDYQRDKQLRETLRDELYDSDVIVFEEIVDVPRLERYIIQGKMQCLTYYNSAANHQHVVLCHKSKYRFEKANGDKNFIIEEVTEGTKKGRPALYGLLRDSYSGEAVAYVVGVHLKAFPEETALRLKQTEAIAKRLRQLTPNIPVIITGDFNTYNRDKTSYNKDDNYLIGDVLDKYRLNMYEVRNYNPYTFLSSSGQNKFDRFFVSDGVGVEEQVSVSDLCAEPGSLSTSDIKWYNDNVSDHCLVSVTLSLP